MTSRRTPFNNIHLIRFLLYSPFSVRYSNTGPAKTCTEHPKHHHHHHKKNERAWKKNKKSDHYFHSLVLFTAVKREYILTESEENMICVSAVSYEMIKILVYNKIL